MKPFDTHSQDELLRKMMDDAKKTHEAVKKRDGPSGWRPRPIFGSSKVERRRNEVMRARAEGLTHSQIADQLGISKSMVKMDVMFMRDRAKMRAYAGQKVENLDSSTDGENEKIRTLRQEGLTSREISEVIGLSQGAVSHRITTMKAKGINV